MAASYNWTYKPGIPNKYGISIDESDDSVCPANACYVALFGNDATGNGSRELPYRTITYAVTNTSLDWIILGSGVYREAATINYNTTSGFVGDGDVTVDISYIGVLLAGSNQGPVCNITILGDTVSSLWATAGRIIGGMTDVKFNGAWFSNNPNDGLNFQMVNCVVWNYSAPMTIVALSTNTITNCTFYKCSKITLFLGNGSTSKIVSCLFSNCNIGTPSGQAILWTSLIYSLFWQCNFNISGDGGGLLYPSVPSGYTYYSDIADIIADYLTEYGANALRGCKIADPILNNPGNGDFSLGITSNAKNLSYFGTFVGAIGIGMSIVARATESAGSFDFSTKVNLTIADDSITFTDDTADGQIDTKPQLNSQTRIINALPLFGFNADRNGQYVDSIPDLGSVVTTSGTLAYPSSWIVQAAAIVYNGTTYQPGDRFTTVSGQSTFTSTSGGQVQEIVEAPERHTIMARFSDGGDSVLSSDALIVGNWYFVVNGSVTYGGTSYAAGTYFRATDNSSWSDDATGAAVETAFPDEGTLAFQHYDPAFQPTTNNVGDVRTGAVLRGNGDPAYVRGTGYEWPVNSKHMQFRYMLKHNNLTP